MFINPFTDFGFKKLFGEESALPRLKSFIEDALGLAIPIESLRFLSPEQLGSRDDERRAVYDIYCTAADGSHFIVELQKAKQHFFKDRTVFYASFPIRSQALRGNWDYRLYPVYCLGILDFEFTDTDKLRWHHVVQLKDQEGDVFYDKLTFAFLELAKFKKPLEACSSHLERWCYLLRNLQNMDSVPELLTQDPLFKSAFEVANYSAMSVAEQRVYNEAEKRYRDLVNVVNTAYDDGVASVKTQLIEAEQRCRDLEIVVNTAYDDGVASVKTQLIEVEQQLQAERHRAESTVQNAIKALMASGKTEAEAKKQILRE